MAGQEFPEIAPQATPPPAQGISAAFPDAVRRWEPQIVAVSSQYQVDPNLVAAMMTLESGGRPDDISPSGACGLMQVMARDTATVKPWLFRNRPTCAELQEPAFNILWGVDYLVYLYNYWGKNWREALYHYGPEDVGYTYAERVIALWNRAH